MQQQVKSEVKRGPLVDLAVIKTFFLAQVKFGVRYRLGGKARSLDVGPDDTASIDCSGEVRLLFHKAGEFKFPDGSWHQRAWCEDNWEEVPYSRALAAKGNELFIAFITAGERGCGKVGHVWLVCQMDDDAPAETMESYGGVGVRSRRADSSSLVRMVHKCFRVPTVQEIAQDAEIEPGESLLVWNGAPLPVVFLDGRPYVQLRALLERMRHRVLKTTDRTQEKPPRYYLNSELIPTKT